MGINNGGPLGEPGKRFKRHRRGGHGEGDELALSVGGAVVAWPSRAFEASISNHAICGQRVG